MTISTTEMAEFLGNFFVAMDKSFQSKCGTAFIYFLAVLYLWGKMDDLKLDAARKAPAQAADGAGGDVEMPGK